MSRQIKRTGRINLSRLVRGKAKGNRYLKHSINYITAGVGERK